LIRNAGVIIAAKNVGIILQVIVWKRHDYGPSALYRFHNQFSRSSRESFRDSDKVPQRPFDCGHTS
jgi:hypothetical protein